jgi:hypothetical protein
MPWLGTLDRSREKALGSHALLDQAWCAEFAKQLSGIQRIVLCIPVDAVAMQCTLFDKSPDKNWLVALHQDLSIPVKCRVDSPDCSGWSEKEGQAYVQPPVIVLEQLVAVRIHVDDCPAESGALRVVPNPKLKGGWIGGRAEELRRQSGETAVPVTRGSALVMRPLILHASSKAMELRQRRVLICVRTTSAAVGAGAVGGLGVASVGSLFPGDQRPGKEDGLLAIP